jgi:Fic family protein
MTPILSPDHDPLSQPTVEPVLPQLEMDALRAAYHAFLMNQTQDDNLDLSPLYPATTEIAALLLQLDDLKRCLDSFRPLSAHQAKNLAAVFETEFTYDSNRIEGNTLTLRETALILEKGITVTGKSMREHLEVVNHHEALEFVKELIAGRIDYEERALLEIHRLVLNGIDRQNAGKYRRERVFITGSRHVPPNPLKVPDLMRAYFEYYEEQKAQQHPALLAADMSEKLVTIHPFIDGNGRTCRLVMNFLLMRAGFPITNISGEREHRTAYYDALQAVQLEQNPEAFQRFALQEMKLSFFRYLNAVSVNLNPDEQHKGAYFFQKIAPLVQGKEDLQ